LIWFRELIVLLVLAGGGSLSAGATPGTQASDPAPPGCGGLLQQGGLVICQAPPGTQFRWNDRQVRADEEGWAMFGLGRDAGEKLEISIRPPQGAKIVEELTIEPRNDAFRVIEGLDCDKVDARTPEQKAHAGRSWVKKQDAFGTFHEGRGALDGFVRPAKGPPSSPFGPARKYVGVSAQTGEACEKVSVHRGYDIAAPTGTPVIAPAPGTVTLADPDLYYEGGTVFLDHGHGLVSVFMHLSEVDVSAGDEISSGARLGAVGNTGRTTGPHLHWAVKWRDMTRDDRSGDFYIDPALLLKLDGGKAMSARRKDGAPVQTGSINPE
jgi:murein DD-endopeptidase MepM/ murein hydrolase activator NlpD